MWYIPWVLLTSVFFLCKSGTIVISRNRDIDCILIAFWVFKDCFNKDSCNLDDEKLSTLDLLKIKVSWNKSYDIIISVHDITNKIYHLVQIIL